jgi:TonB family C-terminal domain
MFDNLRNVLDFDDLLFENRNKDYGAYQLRKRYNSVVIICLFIASLFISSLVIIPFVLRPHTDNVLIGNGNFAQLQLENLEPPKEQIYVPTSPPPQSVKVEEVQKYVPPVIVDSVPLLEKAPLSTDEYMNQTTNPKVDDNGTGNGDSMMGQEGTESDEPFFLVEVMPSFKGGGLEKFREWISKRTKYPDAAIAKRIRGTVFLTFIVEKDGSVSNVNVVKGVDPLLDDEAVKAISESPKWTPGLQRGEPVRVRYSIPLNFMF